MKPQEKIQFIQNELIKHKADAYLVPCNDRYFSEYSPDNDNRLQFITNFSGSNGLAIITKKDNVFFTDSRYTIQAQKELDHTLFKIFDIMHKRPQDWVKENNIKTLLYDPWLYNKKSIESYKVEIKSYENLIDKIWHRKQDYITQIEQYPIEFAGVNYQSKIKELVKDLKADYLLLTDSSSICWLLNIRGDDIQYSRLILAYVIIDKNGLVSVFTKNKLSKKLNLENVDFYHVNEIEKFIEVIKHKKVQIDPDSCPYWFNMQLTNIIEKTDPCILIKACKNNSEITGAINAHIKDGEALIRFFYWLEKNLNKTEITELCIVDKLLEFRKKQPGFICPSFDTIAGFAENGAIVHYRANKSSNKIIDDSNLLLVDSGGQYYGGTTDVTRTIHLGKPTDEQIRNYSLVLKGHIAIAKLIFPRKINGSHIDILARMHLWQEDKDYGHGTGHGVGNCLNVHEGPQSISRYATKTELQKNMIISNEPGYYKEGEYGIRIENLVYVKNHNENFLKFSDLTMLPYEIKLIDQKLLTIEEINWLNAYHHKILKIMQPLLDSEIYQWLKDKCKTLC